MRAVLWLAILVCACAPRPYKLAYDPASPQSLRVDYSDGCHNIHPNMCPAFQPYWRPGDPVAGPIYWFRSETRMVCVVTPEEFHRFAMYYNKRFTCSGRWRQARLGG